MNNGTETAADFAELLEWDRRRVGEELHDTICQTLSGATLLLEVISRASTDGKPPSTDVLARFRNVVERATNEARALSRRFDPPPFNPAGLLGALQDLATQVPGCEFICEKPVFVTQPDAALALHRIAETACFNYGQHSRSSTIRLEEQTGTVRLIIECCIRSGAENPDDFRLAKKLMEIRAAAAGGAFTMDEGSDGCLVFVCELPSQN